MMKKGWTTVLILAITFLGAGLAFADGKDLFEAKCSTCHPLSRSQALTKDRDGWTATVTRMQKTNRCPITDDEAKAIVDYLVMAHGPAQAEKK